MDTGYGRTRETVRKGNFNVVYSYLEEAVGRFAGPCGYAIFLDLPKARNKTNQGGYRKDIQECVRSGKMFVSVRHRILVEEAGVRDIPFIRLMTSRWFNSDTAFTRTHSGDDDGNTNIDRVPISPAKQTRDQDLLGDMACQCQKAIVFAMKTSLRETIERIGYPIVIKPLAGNHRQGCDVPY